MEMRSRMCSCEIPNRLTTKAKPAITAGLLLLYQWNRRESNPGPNIFTESFLHAYFCIGLSELGRGKTNQPRPYPFEFRYPLTETMSTYSAIGLIQRLETQQTAAHSGHNGCANLIRQPWRS